MIISSTELKNNLGKYLMDCFKDDIVITKNGRRVAVLSQYNKNSGHLPPIIDEGVVSESLAEAYNAKPLRMSYEEFLEISAKGQKRLEYIDGEVYLLASPSITHQKVLGGLYTVFKDWAGGRGCVPMLSPFDITLTKKTNNRNVVQPDLMLICDLKESTDEKDRYTGIPVLIAEIISKTSKRMDTIKKMDLYMVSGVREYWIVNPFNKEISVYLFKDGDISSNTTYKQGETASSLLLKDLRFEHKELFES